MYLTQLCWPSWFHPTRCVCLWEGPSLWLGPYLDRCRSVLHPPPPESRATDCSTVSPAAIPPPLHPHYDHRIVKSLMLRLWLMADQNYLGLGRDAMEGARRTESKVNRSTTTMNGRPQRSLHPVVVTLVLAYKLFEYY